MAMKLKDEKFVKGMIFAGCSFTWGQGLNYYNNFPTNVEMPLGKFDKVFLTASQVKYIEKYRFPKLVADHYNTFEFVRWANGGSNQDATSWFNTLFNQVSNLDTQEVLIIEGQRPMRVDYSEISHIIFQFTQPERDKIKLVIDGKTYNEGYLEWVELYNEQLEKYLDVNNLDFEEWTELSIIQSIQNVKNFLQDCENKGIQIIITTWPFENLKYIYNDEWLFQRLLPLKYKGETFYSFHDLVGGTGREMLPPPNKELVICHDYENFITPPTDMHLSKQGHKVIADSLIAYIENKREHL
jgi:hypothetical protein